jgi:hypothetical protein
LPSLAEAGMISTSPTGRVRRARETTAPYGAVQKLHGQGWQSARETTASHDAYYFASLK